MADSIPEEVKVAQAEGACWTGSERFNVSAISVTRAQVMEVMVEGL